MIQGTIIRGTTPKHVFDLPYPREEISNIRIIYGQNGKSLFVKLGKDCSFLDKKVEVSLSQEDTYLMKPNKILDVEIKIKLVNNNVVRPEEPIHYRVLDSMDAEIME